MDHDYCIAGITGPNAVTPGALVLARGIFSRGDWARDLRAVEVQQAEWVDKPGSFLLERVAAASRAVHGQGRIVVATNFWANAQRKIGEHNMTADTLVRIKAGDTPPTTEYPFTSIGRMYLLDLLRDSFPKLSVTLPDERLESHPQIIVAHELRSAVREISHRPRTIDEETMAPGLDRGDVLVLAIALAVEDLERNGPVDYRDDNINAAFHGYDYGYDRSR